ncbi:hypothetical protein SERLA73DRAFT_97675 [Serpula lacrymans var. lacrymans S7.3]|uniref:RCC1/BLIP-II protein n=2 Tax=Serpula lacrymans var. lacrymans TaxID=341189 RepID=F8QDQ4_SERL3|nr:uncharacterized protein SERLADRAFT_454000 [Serpula lacrymans var. lacrymans S7.9]EGN93725.1 hypothetical protein SERLA73DRAFT_97675 [Serpula lacrymans var. lacrymans S7.3]EGO19095.1 hypothetical protein SERLADRAFT_454000 [Serpula lacrymans var. lacrymans S7.9]
MTNLYSLWVAGSNARGQLSNGTFDDSHTFAPCLFSESASIFPSTIRRILQLTCGANHTLILLQRSDEHGLETYTELWGCGDGSKGQLGPTLGQVHSATEFRRIPMPLQDTYTPLGYTCRLIAAAWETTYLVLSSPNHPDVLISMGSNDFGALGVESAKIKSAPFGPHAIAVEGLETDSSLLIKSLNAGPRHVVAEVVGVGKNGVKETFLIGWGAGRQGQLGVTLLKRAPQDHAGPRRIPSDKSGDPIVSCSLGNQHTVILHSSGRVSALGSNRKCQVQDINNLSNVHSINCTWNGTYAVVKQEDGMTLLGMGDNSRGQLGREVDGRGSSQSTLVNFPFELKSRELLKVACGSEHVLALFAVLSSSTSHSQISNDDDREREVWAWGWNEHGNLGVGTTGNVERPIKIWPNGGSDSSSMSARVIDVWAGCGTSWIALSHNDNDNDSNG